MNENKDQGRSRSQFTLASGLGMLCCLTLALALAVYQPDAGRAVAAANREPPRNGISSYDELLTVLRGTGAIVRPSVEFSQPFFTGHGQVAQVEDVDVLVVEYATEHVRETESRLISADGNSVGGTPVTWTDQPNFWASGQVIVLYLGQDQRILSLLNSALGPPITAFAPIGARGQE